MSHKTKGQKRDFQRQTIELFAQMPRSQTYDQMNDWLLKQPDFFGWVSGILKARGIVVFDETTREWKGCHTP